MVEAESRQAYDSLIAKAEALKVPLWAHCDLTWRCNLSCLHCYCRNLSGPQWNSRPEMTLAEIKKLIDNLADLGALYLTLSGGEVFTRDDFFDIAAHARARHFCLTIFTNGTLIDRQSAGRIKELLPLAVEMSIYGTTARVHDAITGVRGSFAKLTTATRLLKRQGIKVALKAVILTQNFHQAPGLNDFARSLGADEYRYALEVSPKNDGSTVPQDYQLNPVQLRQIVSARPDPNVEDMFSGDPLEKPLCATGTLACYISPYGDVYPCVQLLRSLGNIRRENLREIWHASHPLRDELAGLKTYGDMAACRSCDSVRFCKKCIGLAWLITHDMSACYEPLATLTRLDAELSTTAGSMHKCEL